MKDNFEPALARVLVYEGGKSNNPKDPGGKTNMGITQSTYNAYRRSINLSVADVYLITHDDVATIYKKNYWDRASCDDLPPGLDFAVFDGAVNSGVGQSVMWLEAACKVTVDGAIGPKTIQAAGDADDETTINDMLSRRLGSLKRLKTWSTFGNGWATRISNVQKIADAWAQAGSGANVGPAPVIVSDQGGHQKASMDDVKTNPINAVATHAVTVGGAVSTGVAQTITNLTPASDTFAYVKYALGGLTVLAAIAGLIVMIGQKANDAAVNADATAKINPDADANATAVPVNDNTAAPSATAIVQAHDVVQTAKAA